MINARDDYSRTVINDARDMVRVRGYVVKTQPLERLMRDAVKATWKQVDAGLLNRRTILRIVREEMTGKYQGVIVTAIIMAVVSYIVRKILERIWG